MAEQTASGDPPPPGRSVAAVRDVTFEQVGTVRAAVLWRGSLKPGDIVDGPVVIEQLDATIILHPGDHGLVDQSGNLIIEVGA